jgi:hypothetical protein
MLGDRRLPFAVEFDQPCIKPQLRRAEANQFLEELEGLLLRETIEEPDEGDLIGKAKPVMGSAHETDYKARSCFLARNVRRAVSLWMRTSRGFMPRTLIGLA